MPMAPAARPFYTLEWTGSNVMRVAPTLPDGTFYLPMFRSGDTLVGSIEGKRVIVRDANPAPPKLPDKPPPPKVTRTPNRHERRAGAAKRRNGR